MQCLLSESQVAIKVNLYLVDINIEITFIIRGDIMEIPNVGGKHNLKVDNLDYMVNKNSEQLQSNLKNVPPLTDRDKNQETIFSTEELDQISKIIEQRLEKLSQIFKGEAHFEIDRDLDILIIKIIEKGTEKVIRQIPPEVSLKLARALNELEGILFDEKA
ncbi:MAG TPA: flagellar protein FlaG [Defluviitoga sp.]|nr:flagellar protein FlaG [Defluviitoga sp.]